MNEKPRFEVHDPGRDPETFELELWPATVALGWQERFMRLGLEPVLELLADDQSRRRIDMILSGGQMSEPEPSSMSRIGTVFLDRLGRDGMVRTVLDLLEGLSRIEADDEGNERVVPVLGKTIRNKTTREPSDFDEFFKGRTMLAWRLVWFVLEANLGDFIDGVRSRLKARQQRSQINSLGDQATEAAAAGDLEKARSCLELAWEGLIVLAGSETENSPPPNLSSSPSTPT